ncbi:hypothetical protein ABC974_28635 [Sphingomonas oligophenolica]|uniref:Tetratricopeptide repeat protein n=1 Tax=Sphingomonas oligophenolica TaxID=301154 RepID=A0ABU9YCR8_9SPHN
MVILKLASIFALVSAGCGCLISTSDRECALDLGYNLQSLFPIRGPNQSRAMAVEALERGDYSRAVASAKRAVSEDPIGQRTASLLGSAFLGEKRTNEALGAFTVAAALGWRDQWVQHFWLSVAQTSGDFRVAAQRVDALLRIGVKDPTVDSSLNFLGESPVGRAALASRLAENPAWVSFYLENLDRRSADTRLQKLMTISQAVHQGLVLDRGYITQITLSLIKSGKASDAFSLWKLIAGTQLNANIPAQDLPFLLSLPNSSASPFEWSLAKAAGLESDVIKTASAKGGTALHFLSQVSWRQTVASRITTLRSGRYRVSWRAASNSGDAPAWVHIGVSCIGGGGVLTSAAATKHLDSLSSYDFSVPPESCSAQTISIAVDPDSASVAREGRISDVKIVRTG